MNCKPGDLAFIAEESRFTPGCYGMVVKVVRPAEPCFGLSTWITEPLPAGYKSLFDRVLRPIRPSEGEDEMLRIAGRPVKEVA